MALRKNISAVPNDVFSGKKMIYFLRKYDVLLTQYEVCLRHIEVSLRDNQIEKDDICGYRPFCAWDAGLNRYISIPFRLSTSAA